MKEPSDKHTGIDDDCLEAFDHLYAYLNGEITDKLTREKLEHHLSHCKSCFSRAQMERELNARIKQSGMEKTPETLQKRLRELIKDL